MKPGMEKNDRAFPAVISAALLQTAARTPWPSVFVTGIAGALLRCLPKPGRENPKWLRYAQGLWSIPVMAQVLHWSAGCWEAPSAGAWVPPVLLALALWLSSKGTAAGDSGDSILGLLQLGLIVPILAAGLGDIRLENLRPMWQRPDGWLLAMLLLPGEKMGTGSGWFWAVLYSIVTVGALNGSGGFYEMSKSISFFGAVKRLEALAAVAMTVGFAVLLRCMLEFFTTRGWAWAGTLGAYALFCTGYSVPGTAAAAVSAALWAILPACVGKTTKRENK